jgi:hypothetical protein
MLLPFGRKRNLDDPTSEELLVLHKYRLDALRTVASYGSLSEAVSASNRVGYTAHIDALGRDQDGSLKARIVVRAPHLIRPYTRRVRLVKRAHLDAELELKRAREQ